MLTNFKCDCTIQVQEIRTLHSKLIEEFKKHELLSEIKQ